MSTLTHSPTNQHHLTPSLVTHSQQEEYEELTRQLEEERRSISDRLQAHQQPSPTESLTSITATEDSFRPPMASWSSQPGGVSLLQEPWHRQEEESGNLNSGYVLDGGNMEYMREDPYSSHRFANHDPYYPGGVYEGGNTSFDRHSEHSMPGDRSRHMKSNQDLPNGGPYGSSHNLEPQQFQSPDGMRASPLPPHRSYSPAYPDSGGGGYPEREAPYHNLAPYDRGREDENNYGDEFGPHSQQYPSHPYDEDLVHAGFGQRDTSYNDIPQGSNYHDPYRDEDPRFNGSDMHQYSQGHPSRDMYEQEDPYSRGPEPGDYSRGSAPGDYSFQDEPPQYFDNRPGSSMNRPEYLPQTLDDQRNGEVEDPYNSSYRDAPHESFQGSAYDPAIHEPHYIDAQRDGPGSMNYPSSQYSDHPSQHPNDSFRGEPHPSDSFHEHPNRYDGLPEVREDPFAVDPFREQRSREMEDPYYRGQSPSGGADPHASPFPDRHMYDGDAPPYDQRDMPDPYSQTAPRYPQESLDGSYAPDQGQVYRPEDPYSLDQDHLRRMEQLTLGAPPDSRRTPSIDGHMDSFMSRNPDLQEVIDFLNSPDPSIQANAAAYLQHLTFMDDKLKAKARSLGGIKMLISLLSHDLVEVHKSACGALQNLSYGRANVDNKREIKRENGIPELIRLLRKTDQEDVKESVTGVLWNLSSCEDLKMAIIENGLTVLVNILLKYCGWNQPSSLGTMSPWTTVCRNTTGILRNVSSAGFDARKRLRECKGLVNTLIQILKLAAEDRLNNNIDNKPVENTVCILRNLSYRIQEVVDPDFYKKRVPTRTISQESNASKNNKKGNSPGCFGNKSQKVKSAQSKSNNQINSALPDLPPASVEYRALWGSEIHTLYSAVLRHCTNPITMEAAAGAIQNLTACDWQPAVESRAKVRKEKGLPLLVDLLSAESPRVVCATATALRNLAIDQKNKDLIGNYAVIQLINRLPQDSRKLMPDDAICAIIAILYEVIKDQQNFALQLVQEKGLPRLMFINTSKGIFLPRTLKFTLTLLKTLWSFKALHSTYSKLNLTQNDFTMSRSTPRDDMSRTPEMSPSSSNHTTPYNTLSRPMSGQGYDDSTLTPVRAQQMRPVQGGYYGDPHTRTDSHRMMDRSTASLNKSKDAENISYSRERFIDNIPLNDMGPGYAPLDEPRPHPKTKPPVGGVPLFPNLDPAEPPPQMNQMHGDHHSGNEPLYASVKRENKSNRRRNDPYNDSSLPDGYPSMHHSMDAGPGNEHFHDSIGLHDGYAVEVHPSMDGGGGGADSWV